MYTPYPIYICTLFPYTYVHSVSHIHMYTLSFVLMDIDMDIDVFLNTESKHITKISKMKMKSAQMKAFDTECTYV